jgi:hydrogenase maturation protease
MTEEHSTPGAARRLLVAGLGNELCGDDGVGVHTCRLLAPRIEALGRDDVVVAEIGTAVCDALHLLEWADHVLCIDAMRAGGLPGSIYLAAPGDLEDEGRVSLHQLSLLGALQLLELEHGAPTGDRADRAPGKGWRGPRVEILGVEPASLALGLGLSPQVEAALPRVLEHVWQTVSRWSQAARGD